jgi:Mg/Co/Ni transporter MgtE
LTIVFSMSISMADEQKQLLEQIELLLESGDMPALSELLNDERSSDIAEIVELVGNEERRAIFDVMDKSMSAEVLEKVDEATRAELFELLKVEELISLVSENAAVAKAIRKNPHRGDRRGFLLRLRCEQNRAISRRSWSPRLLVCFCLFCSAE